MTRSCDRPTRSAYIPVGILVLCNLIFQWCCFHHGFDNQPVNAHSITSTDSLNYIHTAQQFIESGFNETFRKGYRLPGYPLFLAFFQRLFPQPLLAARIAQSLLSSSLILLSYLTLRGVTRSHRTATLGMLLTFIWIPFYHFSPILYAEALSLFFVGVLLYQMAQVQRDRPVSTIVPIFIIGILTYIRPNHLLFLIPYLGFLWMQFSDLRLDRRLMRLGLAVCFFAMVMMPWSTWLSVENQTLMPLSTTQGSTLYLSTLEGSRQDPEAIYAVEKQKGVQKASQYYELMAKQAWRSNPVGNTQHGFKKILRTFGLNFQRTIDWIMGLQCMAAIVASLWLWQRRQYLPWVFFFWGCIGITAMQSFIFHEGFRFKLILFDMPAILIIVLGVSTLGFWNDRIWKASKGKNLTFKFGIQTRS